MSSLRAFGRDVASDALARWSGGGGILFALAAFVFPKLLNGPWPFLILGVACVMAACVRAWFVAYQRTIPGFEVVSEHPDSVLRSDTRYPRVRHRVVIRSKGLTPIDDVHVFLIMGASGGERSDLLAVGKDSERDLRLYHDVPLAFELFSYDEGSAEIQIVGRRGRTPTWIPMPLEPLEVRLAVVGQDVATRWLSVVITKNGRNVEVHAPRKRAKGHL